MSNASIGALLERVRVLPTITLDRAEDALPLAETLRDAGIGMLEITLRTSAGLPALRALSARPNLGIAVAAGTLRKPDELLAAADAGAQLLVSPGHSPALIALAERLNLPWLPGAATPSEVMLLLEHGHLVQKLFPATPALHAALVGPFAEVRFVATGSIDADAVATWLGQPGIIAIGGSWIAPRALVAAGDWHEIGRRARAASSIARGMNAPR